mmetsp:Transcript_123270/g.348324  ORF Transcript_123270/g.348324 Transcript_123270/m.348324 type:complete len:351 (-) Transcript_123270:392-1444(-)
MNCIESHARAGQILANILRALEVLSGQARVQEDAESDIRRRDVARAHLFAELHAAIMLTTAREVLQQGVVSDRIWRLAEGIAASDDRRELRSALGAACGHRAVPCEGVDAIMHAADVVQSVREPACVPAAGKAACQVDEVVPRGRNTQATKAPVVDHAAVEFAGLGGDVEQNAQQSCRGGPRRVRAHELIVGGEPGLEVTGGGTRLERSGEVFLHAVRELLAPKAPLRGARPCHGQQAGQLRDAATPHRGCEHVPLVCLWRRGIRCRQGCRLWRRRCGCRWCWRHLRGRGCVCLTGCSANGFGATGFGVSVAAIGAVAALPRLRQLLSFPLREPPALAPRKQRRDEEEST